MLQARNRRENKQMHVKYNFDQIKSAQQTLLDWLKTILLHAEAQ
jgi:hypothetical protein